jgi:hypothetical protein
MIEHRSDRYGNRSMAMLGVDSGRLGDDVALDLPLMTSLDESTPEVPWDRPSDRSAGRTPTTF